MNLVRVKTLRTKTIWHHWLVICLIFVWPGIMLDLGTFWKAGIFCPSRTILSCLWMAFPGGASKEPACQCWRHKRQGSGKSPGGEKDNSLQYSCLKNPMNRGAWWATVHRVAKSQTSLKCLSSHLSLTKFLNLIFLFSFFSPAPLLPQVLKI